MSERGIDICHETIRFWVQRFGSKIARSIKRKRIDKHYNWQWHLDEVFVKINGETHYLWRAVDLYGEVLECYVSKRRNKKAAKKFILKLLKKHGSPKIITTDKLRSYGAALKEIGIEKHQLSSKRSNNRCENSHLPFRRRERAMPKFKAWPVYSDSLVFKDKFTTILILIGTLSAGKHLKKNALLLLMSGTV